MAWGFLAVALLANVAGYWFNLYEQFVWFDEVLHAYTMFAITLFLALVLYNVVLTGVQHHPLALVLVIAGIGLALGTLWEIGEWGYDQLVQPNIILGKTDTIYDLILDTGGALLAGALAAVMLKQASHRSSSNE